MKKLGFTKKLGFIIGIIALLMAVMPMSDGLVVQAVPLDREYGDAPDGAWGTYPSYLASSGVRHVQNWESEILGLGLGPPWDSKDFEPDAWVPDADLFDDGLNTFFIAANDPMATVTFEVTDFMQGGPPLWVNILIDLNIDGDWNDAGEHVVVNDPVPAGPGQWVLLSSTFSTAGAKPGWTWLRLTLTRTPIGAGWDGTVLVPFEYGETEDHEIYIEPGEEGDWVWKDGNFTDYALSGMPDFDQKQDAWTNPGTGNWSYCGPTAVANSMWWFDSRNETGDIPPPDISDNYPLVTSYNPGQWDDHSVSNVEPLINDLAYLMDTDGQRTNTTKSGTDVYDMQWGINQFLVNAGLYGYYYELTRLRPEFDWIAYEVERCEDVILLLGFWQQQYDPEPHWVRIGGHYVTCAGVNWYDYQLGISDPNWDNAEKTGIGRVLPPAPPHPDYPHNASVHNDTWYVSHDTYNVTCYYYDCPGGPCVLENYAVDKDITNFTGQNSGPEFAGYEGEYDGESGFPVVTQIDYAVAVSPKPDLNDVIDSSYKWAKDGENVSVRVHVKDPAWDGIIWDVEIFFWTEETGSEFVYYEYLQPPLQYCQNYTFVTNATTWNYPFLPEIVVVHFSNEWYENIGFAFSDPVWYYKPGGWEDYALSGMPDFDQRQDNWTDDGTTTGNWTYCGPVAVANSLWWFDSREEPLPQPPSIINDHYGLVTSYDLGQWDDHNVSNVEPLVNDLASLMHTGPNGTDVMEMQKGIDKYLVNRSYYGYYYEKTFPSPPFELIAEEVERCEDVILLLGFWQSYDYQAPPWEWWRIGGHYVTVAGVNSEDWQLAISDPCRDNFEAGMGPGRVPVPHTYPHNASVHNDTQYVSHDIYDVTCGFYQCPGGPCVLEGYAVGPDIQNFTGQNCPEEFWDLQQEWIPEPGFPVVTQIDYAVAVSPKEDLNEAIESDYNLTEENVTVRVHVTDEDWNNTIWDIEILFWTEANGTQWVFSDVFTSPLEYCVDYYFNVTYVAPPDKVVLHFSNEWYENIGFAFSYLEGTLATLVGNVTFEGRGSNNAKWIEDFTVHFFQSGSEMAWSPINATTNTTGFFNIPGLTPGKYDVGIKNATCLSEVVTNVTLTAGMTTPPVDFGTPREGDVNNDDNIDMLDLGTLAAAWGTWPGQPGWDAGADFNRDDSIDMLDLGTLAGLWGQWGEILDL